MEKGKTLLLVRHAKSSHDIPFLEDKLRPLADRGKSDAQLVGQRLQSLKLDPDKVYCSSAVRTRSTLAILNWHLNLPDQIITYHDDLYTFDDDGTIYEGYLHQNTESQNTVMILSHNNSIINVAHSVSKGEIDTFPTCSVLVCRWDETDWSQAKFNNINSFSLITPKLLKK